MLLCRPMLTWVAVLCHLSEPGYMEGGLCPWSTSSRSKCTRQVGTVHSWTVSMIILSPGDKLKTKLPPVHQTLQFCSTYPFKHGNYMKASITLKTGHVDHWLHHCWSLITSLLIIDHLTVDCWLSIASLLTVDCWSSITSLLTVDPLTVDCWSLIHPWSMIISLSTVDLGGGSTVNMERVNSQLWF